MEMTIARDRWQQHLKSAGHYYREIASELRALHARHPEVGAGTAALAADALAGVLEACRTRPAHPQPARAAPPRRTDRLTPRARAASPAAPRRRSTAVLPDKADHRFDAAGPRRDEPRVRRATPPTRWRAKALRWVIGAGPPRRRRGRRRSSSRLGAIHARRAGRAACRHGPRCRRPVRARRRGVSDRGLSVMSTSQHDAYRLLSGPAAADRRRRHGRHHARGAHCGGVLAEHHRRPLLHHRRSEGTVGPGPVLRPGPERARQDLLAHRRLGPRVRMGPDRLAPAAAAQGQRADGRRPEVVGSRRARGPRRRRLARLERRPGAGRGGDRQRAGRREALRDQPADPVRRSSPANSPRSPAFAALPARHAGNRHRRDHPGPS